MAQSVMASMAGLRGSSQEVLEGRLHSSRLSTGNTARIAVPRPGFCVHAQQQISAETETSRRALLGLVAAGVVSGPFVQAVLADTEVDGLPKLGGFQPIADLKDPEVVKLANFAVAQHNREAQTSLVFSSVVRGEYQVVNGINYRLTIAAYTGRAAPRNYLAEIYSKPQNYPVLVSFKELLQ